MLHVLTRLVLEGRKSTHFLRERGGGKGRQWLRFSRIARCASSAVFIFLYTLLSSSSVTTHTNIAQENSNNLLHLSSCLPRWGQIPYYKARLAATQGLHTTRLAATQSQPFYRCQADIYHSSPITRHHRCCFISNQF